MFLLCIVGKLQFMIIATLRNPVWNGKPSPSLPVTPTASSTPAFLIMKFCLKESNCSN